MERLLVCTDGSIFAQSSYRYAAWLAIRLGARVDVLYVTDEQRQVAAAATDFSGSLGFDAAATLLDKLVTLEHEKAKLSHQRAQHILQDAEQVLLSQGVTSVKVIHETGSLVDRFPEFEASADLIILGKRGETAELASGHLGANLERIIRASHKPCLVTSRQYQTIERLLLAYDGSPSGQKLLRFLVNSPVFKGLELHIVTVAKDAADAKAIARLNEAQQKAATGGFEPVTQLMQGHPETAIAQYSEQHQISLLLMGAYGHSRIRHLVIGSTTAQILRSSNIPVLVFR